MSKPLYLMEVGAVTELREVMCSIYSDVMLYLLSAVSFTACYLFENEWDR